MNVEKLAERLEKTRKAIWHDLMNHIDQEHWATLKRFHNRLTDNIEKLKTMHDENEYAFQDMRDNRKAALQLLRKVKQARKGKKFSLIKMDGRTWKEKEVKPKS